jgi:hypothetical protein
MRLSKLQVYIMLIDEFENHQVMLHIKFKSYTFLFSVFFKEQGEIARWGTSNSYILYPGMLVNISLSLQPNMLCFRNISPLKELGRYTRIFMDDNPHSALTV